jgi:hypothetical protein
MAAARPYRNALTGLIEIKRIELVNTADMSVFTSDYFKPKDGNGIRYHRSLRAFVEPVNDVRIVQFAAGSLMHTEGFLPYCVTGESEATSVHGRGRTGRQ